MSDESVDVREFGPAKDVNADEVFRTIVGQMFENDNDQSELELTLQGTDGTESVIKFDLIIKSINGVETRSGSKSK